MNIVSPSPEKRAKLILLLEDYVIHELALVIIEYVPNDYEIFVNKCDYVIHCTILGYIFMIFKNVSPIKSKKYTYIGCKCPFEEYNIYYPDSKSIENTNYIFPGLEKFIKFLLEKKMTNYYDVLSDVVRFKKVNNLFVYYNISKKFMKFF
jgi:hypothetical protein